MIQAFHLFEEKLNANKIKLFRHKFQYILHFFSYHLIIDSDSFDQKIIQTKKIVVDYTPYDDGYFIICFDKTLLIIKQILISNLKTFFENNLDSVIIFLKDSKKNFDQHITCQYHEDNDDVNDFNEELRNFVFEFNIQESVKPIKDFWKKINNSIAGYLIKKSYENTKINRMKIYFDDRFTKQKEIDCNENNFISLRDIAGTKFSKISLVYSIENQELLIIKKHIFDEEDHDIYQREIDNYRKITGFSPFLSRFYGSYQNSNDKFLVLEFINGKTLKDALDDLNENDKKKILFEIMLSIEYIHNKHFVYRDLKPDNIMIDSNKIAVIIDFDRMIRFEENKKSDQFTGEFGTSYSAPEFNECRFFYESDIYSIGKIILFMFENEINTKDYVELKDMVNKCILDQPNKRPKISQIINDFYFQYLIKIPNQISEKEKIKSLNNIHKLQYSLYWASIAEYNNPYSFIFLGYFYTEGFIFERNIQKAIDYYSIPAKNNNEDAQFLLGELYRDERFGVYDIKKSIEYFNIAAKKNHIAAINNLGFFYVEGKYVPQDINKGIYYLTLAANQNNLTAINNLGFFYFEGKYVQKDINKGIYYLNIAAQNNSPMAQMNLGIAYLDGEDVGKDVKKGMYYLSLSAKQNYVEALKILGSFYCEGKYVEKNINKSIFYFSEAAKQNDSDSQYWLGIIYYYDKKDINKAIKYLTDASKHNDIRSLNLLGKIYLKYKKDKDKAMQYYQYAATLNDARAQNKLGKIYFNNRNSLYDINMAIKYFTDAANQNYAESQCYLGLIFFEGAFIKKDYESSFMYFSQAAKQNYPPALNMLGFFYYYGYYVEQNINQSIYFFEAASKYKYLLALCNLAYIFYEGKFIKRDINKSIIYLNEAAKYNYIPANNFLGTIFLDGQHVKRNVNLAIKYYSNSANQNDAQAQNDLGYIYLNILNDTKKAIDFLTLAANQNLSLAQFNLACIYIKGINIQKDIEKGIKYLKIAADNGHSYAQHNLGYLYYEGKYLKQDIDKAMHYFNYSASQNNELSQFYLANIYYEGKYVKQNINKSIYFFKLSSLPESMFCLAVIYTNGFYINRNINLAIKLYKNASNQYLYYAKNNLAIIYKNGFDVQKNLSYAIVLFNEIISKYEDAISMYNLAHLYFFNQDIDDYLNKSIDLLIKSSLYFSPSMHFLSLALIKKIGTISLEEIKKKINNNQLAIEIYHNILFYQLDKKNFYEYHLNVIKDIDFSFDLHFDPILTSELMNNNDNKEEKVSLKNITIDFYAGFDIL